MNAERAVPTSLPEQDIPHGWSSLAVRLVLFLVLVVALDQGLGSILGHIHPRVVTGDMIGNENAAIQARADILILGSSHAKHHYDDALLTEKFGIRVRNAGSGGSGVAYARAMLSLISAVHRPRMVVLETSWFANELERIHSLDSFYGRTPVVDEMLLADGWRSRARLSIRSYRYSGLVFPMLKNFRRPQTSPWGFLPLDGEVAPDMDLGGNPNAGDQPEPWFEDILVKLIEETRQLGARMVVVRSPHLVDHFPPGVPAIYERLTAKYRIPYIQVMAEQEPAFARRENYRDQTHLNAKGAKVFTAIIAGRLMPEVLQLKGAAGGSPELVGAKQAP
jgi:hypothetical protein